jgi:hypothetical protein
VSKQSKPTKKTVELKPVERVSRIRRDPVPEQQRGLAAIDWGSREWEVRFAVAGIIFFALAASALVIDLGQVLEYLQY